MSFVKSALAESLGIAGMTVLNQRLPRVNKSRAITRIVHQSQL